jgi:hypothetical protein
MHLKQGPRHVLPGISSELLNLDSDSVFVIILSLSHSKGGIPPKVVGDCLLP